MAGGGSGIVVVADGDLNVRRILHRVLSANGFFPVVVERLDACLNSLVAHGPASALIFDVAFVAPHAVQLIASAKQLVPGVLLLAVAPLGDERDYVDLIAAGASGGIPRAEAHIVLVPLLRNLLAQSRAASRGAPPSTFGLAQGTALHQTGLAPHMSAAAQPEMPNVVVGTVVSSSPVKPQGVMGQRLVEYLNQLKSTDYYTMLGVEPGATADAVKTAFLTLSKRCHPNRFSREPPEVQRVATEIFLLLKKAHNVLSDPRDAERYQATLRGRGDESASKKRRIQRTELALGMEEVEVTMAGERLVHQGSFEKARELFRQAIIRNANNLELRARFTWVNAVEAEQRGEYELAIHLYEQVVSYDSAFGHALDALRRLRGAGWGSRGHG